MCTCQLNKAEKQKILKCHKSSKQKIEIAIKRRKSYAQLEPVKKKICLGRFQQYYKNNQQEVLTSRAEKYKSMDASEKQNLLTAHVEKYNSMDVNEKQEVLAKRREAYKNMESSEKVNMLTKKKKVASTCNVRQAKPTTHNDLDSCITCFQEKVRGPLLYMFCV